MRNNPRFYQAKAKFTPEITLQKYKANGRVTDDDEKLILAYLKKRKAVNKRGLSEGRRGNIIKYLCYWKRYLKTDYRKATIEDIRDAVGEFRTAKTEKPMKAKTNGGSFKKNTMTGYINTLKSFYYYMIAEQECKIPYQLIKEIESPGLDVNTTKAEQLFTTQDIMKLIKAERHPMHRAFIACMMETLCRPEELTSLTWGDLKYDQDGLILEFVDNKTEGERTVFLTYAATYLLEWKNSTPGPIGTDDFIFVHKRKNEILTLTWEGAKGILRHACEKAHIKDKQIKLYCGRKSGITNMYKTDTNPKAISMGAWGRPNSSMEKVYVKFSGKDVVNLQKKGKGIPTEGIQEEKIPASHECPRCHHMNEPDRDLCFICHTPVSLEAIKLAQESKNKLSEMIHQAIREEMSKIEKK